MSTACRASIQRAFQCGILTAEQCHDAVSLRIPNLQRNQGGFRDEVEFTFHILCISWTARVAIQRIGTEMDTCMKRTPRAVAVLALALASNTSDARSVNPKHLNKVEPPVVYTLAHDVAVEGYNITYTVRAGAYTLRYEDSKGQYLIGEGDCLHLDIHSPKMTGSNDWNCGLYLPKKADRGASFYRIRPAVGTNPEMGPVVNAIIRYGYGSFDWPDKAESMQLRNELTAQRP